MFPKEKLYQKFIFEILQKYNGTGNVVTYARCYDVMRLFLNDQHKFLVHKRPKTRRKIKLF